MKELYILRVIFFVALNLLIVNACKDDESFTQVTAFEKGISDAVNDYRVTIGKPEMNLQFLLIDDAKAYSLNMANKSVPFGIDGVTSDLENQKVLLGADSSAAWVAYCEYENPDSVLITALKDPESKRKIEGYFNQSAVGTAKDVNGNWYITGLMLHFK
jgi:hypothetical protein